MEWVRRPLAVCYYSACESYSSSVMSLGMSADYGRRIVWQRTQFLCCRHVRSSSILACELSADMIYLCPQSRLPHHKSTRLDACKSESRDGFPASRRACPRRKQVSRKLPCYAVHGSTLMNALLDVLNSSMLCSSDMAAPVDYVPRTATSQKPK
jgi:hypothetical protein